MMNWPWWTIGASQSCVIKSQVPLDDKKKTLLLGLGVRYSMNSKSVYYFPSPLMSN